MARVDQSMVIDAVDPEDVPVTTVRRSEGFEIRAIFRGVPDLVFDSRGQLLLQQIANTRTRHPGYWGSSVAAYLFAGESYRAAAERRLAQELGVCNTPLDYIGKTSMEDVESKKFIAVFTAKHDGPFAFDTNQIQRLEFLPIRVIHEFYKNGARAFTPTFLKVLAFYESTIEA
jgi:isopentenyl-diphosphate Delta-isomerase